MFKYKHVTIKFRPPVIRGENLTIIDTNLKSKKARTGTRSRYDSQIPWSERMVREFDFCRNDDH